VLEIATPTTTVMLADDHPVVRAGLRTLLDTHDLEVVAEAGDAEQARRFVLGFRPDVLVLDVSMPGGSGLNVIPAVQELSPDTAVVVLTMQQDPAFARAAFRAGARGYVLKQEAGSELVPAIRATAAGGTWLSPAVGARMATAASATARSQDSLTERELDVLRLIALGNENYEIAVRLELSARTVETLRARIQEKLGVSARAALVRYALDHDLLDR
jgi:two-component system response regulator NreC